MTRPGSRLLTSRAVLLAGRTDSKVGGFFVRGIERKWEEKETARQTDSRKILRERERDCTI